MPDNAIYHLVRAVDRMSRYEFPVQLDDANRGYFTGMSKIVGGEAGAAMAAVVGNPRMRPPGRVLDKDQELARHAAHHLRCHHALCRTRDQRLAATGTANINCRIFPGVSREAILAQLVRSPADPAVVITIPEVRGPVARAITLTPRITEADRETGG